MLLFGGNLSGGKQPSVKVCKPQHLSSLSAENGSSIGSESSSMTPHTEALHQLSNHELRLLEELERTRSKLQAEWRLKLANLQRQQPDAYSHMVSNVHDGMVLRVEELEKRFQVVNGGTDSKARFHDEVQDVMHSKTLDLSPSQRSKSFLKHKKVRATPRSRNANQAIHPNVRTGLDMLPVLTTTGETPFEVGLEAHLAAGQQQQQQHVLPVFRLPSVNVANTASAMAAKEVQAIKKDIDRKQASEKLGLSMGEIEALETELSGARNEVSLQPPLVLYEPNQVSLRGQDKLSLHVRGKNKRCQHLQLNKRKSDSRILQPKKGSVAAEDDGALCKELESALHNVQCLTQLVKNDICWAQKICPVSDLRTTRYFKRWGRQKVEDIFRRLLYNLQGGAMERWKQVVAYEKQQEKLQAYLFYKGSKKVELFLLNWSQRKLRQAWTNWWSQIMHEKALERSALELQATQIIQRTWRAHLGRMFAHLVKTQKLMAKQTTAAIKIQRIFRGGIARKFLKLKKLEQHRYIMATRIQALTRGYLMRKLAIQMRDERTQYLAASRVQALYRGRKARREVVTLREKQRLTNAAVRIQRRYRARLGRAAYIRRRLDRQRYVAATKIQSMARSKRARKIVSNLREDERKRQAIRCAAATNIQRVYRGHRARLSTELKLLALRERNRIIAEAAITIQTLVRKRQAVCHVNDLRQKRTARFVHHARGWVEYWHKDSAKWFYYHQETGEALWAPPATGYTKADGKLVLQDGRIIENDDIESLLSAQKMPLNFGPNKDNSNAVDKDNDKNEDEDDEDRVCVECEVEDARRHCAQCEDVFCDACYEKSHQSVKRSKHTWKAIGTLRCIECEKMRATRWCSVCEDPYCLGCFTIIHSKGNKTSHQWTDMAVFKKAARQKQQMAKEEESAQTYDEFVQSSEYQYVTEYAVAESTSETQAYAQSYDQTYTEAASAAKDLGAWMTLVDEASGYTYYYNSLTGESRWA